MDTCSPHSVGRQSLNPRDGAMSYNSSVYVVPMCEAFPPLHNHMFDIPPPLR